MMIQSIYCAFSLAKLRWLILLVFPVALVSAYQITGSAESAYSLGAAMAACAWLLYRLDSMKPEVIAVWLVVVVFLAFYFLRYPVLLHDPARVAIMNPDSISTIFLNDHTGLTEALKLSSFVFVVFCVSTGIQLRNGIAKSYSDHSVIRHENPQILLWLFFVVPLLMLALGYIAFIYRIGQMGVDPGEPLPFRLKGVFFYARHVLIPLLILAIIYRATLAGETRSVLVGLILLAMHGVSDVILRGSKSSLLLCLLLVIFLAASEGIRIRRKGLVMIGVLALSGILLMPTITQYRAFRFDNDAGLLQLFFSALIAANQDFIGVLNKSFNDLYFRIPGIETTWAIHYLVEEPLGPGLFETIRSQFGVTGYLNFEIYQVPVEAYTLYAPGFVGWLYLAGGWSGLTIGSIVLALLCVWMPRWFYGGRLLWPPVANTFFLWILFVSLTDGTLDGNFLLIAAGVSTLFGLQFINRVINFSSSTRFK
jgi:hypothetical protein